MAGGSDGSPPNVDRKTALVLFVLMLLGFVVESQLTQYVETTLGFEQPFLLFYIVHGSFAVLFPLHLLYLSYSTPFSIQDLWAILTVTILSHLGPDDPAAADRFPLHNVLRLTAILTLGVTVPGLLWFAAVSMASISDVTAIWNCNAFFAYMITVVLDRLPWDFRRLGAVLVASLGVMMVIYGGSAPSTSKDPFLSTSPEPSHSSATPIVGDILTLIASFGYGLYQVMYKRLAALPSSSYPDSEQGPILAPYHSVATAESEIADIDVITTHTKLEPALPFGLYANFWTFTIGICTLAILWVFVPILHWTGVERYTPPRDTSTIIGIVGLVTGGVMFNGCFMILLALWGPVIVSVGSLLTIVLVLFSDVVLFGAWEALTLWSLSGCTLVVGAFGILALTMRSVEE